MFEIRKHFKVVFNVPTKTQRGWDLFLDGEWYGWYKTRREIEFLFRREIEEGRFIN